MRGVRNKRGTVCVCVAISSPSVCNEIVYLLFDLCNSNSSGGLLVYKFSY